MNASNASIPAPQPHPETQPFWDATARGELMLRDCEDCRRAHWYPRAICPHCGSERTRWLRASGDATLYSFSVMRRVAQPYAIAYVTLAEGPTMLTNLVDCDFDGLRVGQRLRVAFAPAEGGFAVPMFTPARESAA